MVDQGTKPFGETSFQGREESDTKCRKGYRPSDNTHTILNQKISMHVAGGGKSSSWLLETKTWGGEEMYE